MGNAYQTLTDCAALGESVTVTGYNSPPNLGRVIGIVYNATTRSNNHAYNGMTLKQHADYAYPGNMITPTVLPAANKAHNLKDGADAHSGNFGNPSWWTGLNFSTIYWDLNIVAAKGYPRLRASPNGPVMGGQ
jgi:hypothetical protein